MQSIVDHNVLRDFVSDKTRGMWLSGNNRFLAASDRSYWVPPYDQVDPILQRCAVSHHGSQGDIFDCDDYAFTLKSRLSFLALQERAMTQDLPIACGIFWGRASWDSGDLHAAIWFATRDDKLVWVEPQYNNAPARAAGKMPIRPTSDRVTELRLMIF